MHIYYFVVTESYYKWMDWSGFSPNVHYHFLTFIRRKYFQPEYMGMACLAKTFNNSCGRAFLLNHFVLCNLSQSPLL